MSTVRWEKSYVQEEEDITGGQTPSQSRHSLDESGPALLSKPVCDMMEENPTCVSSGSLLHAVINHEEDIYTDPDARFQGESQHVIYEAVYSDSTIQPSIFRQEVDQPQKDNMSEQDANKESSDEEEGEDEMVMYTPIYSSYDSSSPVEKQLLTLTNDNIRGSKYLVQDSLERLY